MRVVTGLLLFLALPCAVLGKPKRPHILFILADDWGYNDVSWGQYADIPTPKLEKLRKESLELMQFYTQPKCTAARAALMTGRYPYKMGLQTNMVFSRVRNNTLDPSYKLLPAYLKDLGYHTHMVGKWHLGFCNVNATPIARGFDTHFGSWANLEDRFNLKSADLLDWQWNNKPYWQAQGTFTTHLITNHTQHMLKKHFRNKNTKNDPIFLYVPYLVPHYPAEVLESYIRSTKCSRIPEEIPFNKTANTKNLRRIYCGLVAAMDEGIGNITRTLRNLGVIDDFIIVVTSDNGGAVNVEASNFPLRGNKQTVYEGGTRVRTLLRAPGFLAKGHTTGKYHGLLHVTDVLPTLLSAAKGDVSTLPKTLDGMDSWQYIKRGKATMRKWMVYNIDSDRQLGAIRFKNNSHDFKLVFTNGTQSLTGYRYQDPRPQREQDEDPRNKYYPKNGKAYFLYDLSTNPSEIPASKKDSRYPDAAKTNPKMFRYLKRALAKEFKKEVEVIKYHFLKPDRSRKEGGSWNVAGC